MSDEVWAERAGYGEECDRCHCLAASTYHVGYGDETSEADGDWRYCGTCARAIMKQSDVLGRLITA